MLEALTALTALALLHNAVAAPASALPASAWRGGLDAVSVPALPGPHRVGRHP